MVNLVTKSELTGHMIYIIGREISNEDAKKLITVKDNEVKITVPDKIKAMEFDVGFKLGSGDDLVNTVANVTDMELEDALNVFVSTENITYSEFKDVLFDISPETEITKKLLTIFTEAINETKEESTTEKVYKILKMELMKFFDEKGVLDKHDFMIPDFEKNLADFVKILYPESFVDYFVAVETKDNGMKDILLSFLSILEHMFSYC